MDYYIWTNANAGLDVLTVILLERVKGESLPDALSPPTIHLEKFMSNLVNAVASIFGLSTKGPVDDATKAQMAREKAQDDFKAAVRESNVPVIEEMLASRRVALGDELGRGRGLLQFAVMANSVKAVRTLMEAGADAMSKDSLGASAVQLAKKSGSAMNAALSGVVVA